MLKCGTAYLRKSCRWHPTWTNKTAISVPQHAKFSLRGYRPAPRLGQIHTSQQLFTLGKLVGFGPLAWATPDPWRTRMVPAGNPRAGAFVPRDLARVGWTPISYSARSDTRPPPPS